MAEGNGEVVHPTPVTAWQLIAGVVAVMVTMATALWTINSEILTDLHTNYVTTRSHNDLFDRFNREVTRVDTVVSRIDNDMLPRREFERWKTERDARIDHIEKMLEKLQAEQITRREFDSVLSERGKQIEALRQEITQVRETEEKRHSFINDLFRNLGRPAPRSDQ